MPPNLRKYAFLCLVAPMWLAVDAPLAAVAQPPQVSMDVTSLATGRYGRLHCLLERTFLHVKILVADVRVSRATASQLERLVAGHNYSEALADKAAHVLYDCDDAFARLVFLRDIDIDAFLLGVRSNLDNARRAGVLTDAQRESLRNTIPRTFMALAGRGIREGDTLQYRVHGDAVRTQLFGRNGVKVLDRTDYGAAARLGQMGGYFAPGTDLREDLLHSLF